MDESPKIINTRTGFTVVCTWEEGKNDLTFQIAGPSHLRLREDTVATIHALIASCLDNQGTPPPSAAWISVGKLHAVLNRSIYDLDVSVRALNAMERISLPQRERQIGEIATCSEADFLALNPCGQKTLSEIKQALSDLGLSLNMRKESLHGWEPDSEQLTPAEAVLRLHALLDRPLEEFNIPQYVMAAAVKAIDKQRLRLGDLALLTSADLIKGLNLPRSIAAWSNRLLAKHGLRLGLTKEQLLGWERPTAEDKPTNS